MGAKAPPPLQQQATFWYTMASFVALIVIAILTGDPQYLVGFVPGVLGLSVQRVSASPATAQPDPARDGWSLRAHEDRPPRPTPPPAPPRSRRPGGRTGTGLAVLLVAGGLALGASSCAHAPLSPDDAQFGSDIAELSCDGVDRVCDFAGDVAERVAPDDVGRVENFCAKARPLCTAGEVVTALVLDALSSWSSRSGAVTMNAVDHTYSLGVPADAGPLPAEVGRSGVMFSAAELAAACRSGLDPTTCDMLGHRLWRTGRAEVRLVHRE